MKVMMPKIMSNSNTSTTIMNLIATVTVIVLISTALVSCLSTEESTTTATTKTTTTGTTRSLLDDIDDDRFLETAVLSSVDADTYNSLCISDEIQSTNPVLCRMLTRLEKEPEKLSEDITAWAKRHGLLVGENLFVGNNVKSVSSSFSVPAEGGDGQDDLTVNTGPQLPVVFAHGMGDSCFNSGMIHITNHTSSLLGNVYATCIAIGDNQAEDTSNGYFLNMDASVDVFASKVAADPYLQNGFHAIGLSQGNNVIRGYIARYNTPSVHTFISINGVNAGEGTVPGCFPSLQDNDKNHHDIDNTDERLGGICSLLLEQASRRAYSDFAQEHSFQANYWRDPREEKAEMYHQYSQLARWNNEGPNNNNSTYSENWAKTQKFVWVMATQDGMVWPSQGEWWGQPDSKDPFNTPVIPMNETDWYVNDLFGLKTAQEAGKNFFESFDGDHLQFSIEDFDRWVKTYISARREQYNIHASVQ